MALTTDQILRMADYHRRSGVRGATEATRRSNRNNQNSSTLTRAQTAFLSALDSAPAVERVAPYKHPASAAAILVRGGDPRDSSRPPLTLSERTWAERLPTDPAQVPWEAARRLLSLEASVTDDDDKYLLRSIAAPIREYHDRKAAEHAIAVANQPLIEPPSGTLEALADAISSQAPSLQPHEALGRASTLLQDHVQKRSQELELRRYEAQRQLDQINETAQRRTAVHR